MAPEAAPGLSAGEAEALQELMNIAFGKAVAELAAALGERVELTVPEVQVMPGVLFRYYVGAELRDHVRLEVVEQAFRGELQGDGLLVLPEVLAEAARREAGRVLIRACAQGLAGLLGTEITIGESVSAVEERRAVAARAERIAPGGAATVLRTLFRLGRPEVAGHLFLAFRPEALPWLQAAVQRFLAQYR